MFHIYDKSGKVDTCIEASKETPKRRGSGGLLGGRKKNPAPEVPLEEMDFGKKVLHTAWHPHENAIAIAGLK